MNERVLRPFQVIGHRGAAARTPENTVASLRAGVDAGADQVEFDVGMTRDGRAVLLHDATLNRTTNGRGPLRRAPWRDVEALDAGRWFARRFAGEPLPDLDAALAVLRGRIPVVVEIKAIARRDARPGAADRRLLRQVLDTLDRTGGLEGATLSSTAWPVLGEARALAPDLDLALTVGSSERRDPIAWARKLAASALHPSRRIASAAWIAAAHEAGLLVFPYTVNDSRELDRLLASSADGVFTDDPASLRRLIDRRRPRPRSPGPLFLGIDQGSGGTRAVLVDATGTVREVGEVRVGSRRGSDGAILQDADAVVASIARAAGPILEGSEGSRVAGAGIAAQRSSLVVWRRADGHPVTPVFTWRVGKPFVIPARALDAETRVAKTTGLTVRFPYGALRLAEIAASRREIARGLADGTLRAGPVGAFVAARLTGGDAAVDPSLAQRMLLLDLDTLAWSADLAELFGAPLDALPPILPSASERGTLRIGHRRLPLRALAGDVGAAERAIGVSSRGRGLLVLGTGGFVVVPTTTRRVEIPGLLSSILWQDAMGTRFAVEGTVHGLVAGLLEAGRRMGLRSASPDLIASRGGPARREARVDPAVEGVGTPDWDLTPRFEIEPGRHGPEEIARGTVEGIARRFEAIAHLLRASGRLPETFVATGGLAFAPHLVHAIARRMRVRVEVDPRPHRTAVGAALLASDTDGA